MRSFSFCCFLFLLLSACCVSRSVHAETTPAVVYKDRAYLFGKPEHILSGDIGQAQASPNGRYLLVVGNTPAKERFNNLLANPDTMPPMVTVSLYNARRHSTDILWKKPDDENDIWYYNTICWLADGETALVVVRHSKRIDQEPADKPRYSYTTELLLVSAARGTVRTVPFAGTQTGLFDIHISPSPTRNEAVVLYRTAMDKPCEMQLVSATGITSPVVSLAPTYMVRGAWSEEGTQWAQAASLRPAKEDEKPVVTYAVFDRATKAVRIQSEKPTWFKDKQTISRKEPTNVLKAETRYMRVSLGTTQRDSPAVFVQTEDDRDSVMVALDAEAVYVLGSTTKPVVIYESRGALYSMPAYAVSREDYIAMARKEIEANVRQIDSAMEQWKFDNNVESFPNNSDPIPLLVGEKLYLKWDSGFRDPHTGELAFKNVFNGKPDSTGNMPLFVLKTSVGTVTVYDSSSKYLWSE